MRVFRAYCGVVFIAMLASPVQAQTPASHEQKPSMEELLQRMDALQRRAADGDKLINALQHRLEELEAREKHPKSQTAVVRRETVPSGAEGKRVPTHGVSTQPPLSTNVAALPPTSAAAIPALRPPETMGSQYNGEGQDALRSDLPGLSLRIPATQSEVRFYGFANVNGYRDFNGRNQTESFESRRVQSMRKPVDIAGDVRSALHYGVEPVKKGFLQVGKEAELLQLYRQHRELLADVIVQFSGDVAALFLLGFEQPAAQTGQRFLRFLSLANVNG